MANNMEKGKGR